MRQTAFPEMRRVLRRPRLYTDDEIRRALEAFRRARLVPPATLTEQLSLDDARKPSP